MLLKNAFSFKCLLICCIILVTTIPAFAFASRNVCSLTIHFDSIACSSECIALNLTYKEPFITVTWQRVIWHVVL